MRVTGYPTTCVDLLWVSGHTAARVKRSSVSGNLARDQLVCPTQYILLPLALQESSNEDQSGREEWECPHSTYIWLHPDLDGAASHVTYFKCASFQKKGRVAPEAAPCSHRLYSRGGCLHACVRACQRACVCVSQNGCGSLLQISGLCLLGSCLYPLQTNIVPFICHSQQTIA